MKKLSYLLTAAAALVILTFSVSAFANSISMKSSSAKVTEGTDVTVTVALASAQNVKSGAVEVQVNKAFTLKSVKWNLDSTALQGIDVKGNTGRAVFAWNTLDGSKQIKSKAISGNIITIKLSAAKNSTKTGNAVTDAVKATVKLTNSGEITMSKSLSLTPVDTTAANGINKIGDTWYYTISGIIRSTYNGFADRYDANRNWMARYRIELGKVNFGFTDVAKDGTTWRYYVGGKWQDKATGYYTVKNSRWRVEAGYVITTFTDIVNEGGQWRYYQGGKFQDKMTAVVKKASGVWYYVKNGVVDFTFNGFANSTTGRWKIAGGRIDSSFGGITNKDFVKGDKYNYKYYKSGKWQETFTGFLTAGSRWKIEKGFVITDFNDIVKDANEWRYYQGGKWQNTLTAVAQKQTGGWYYIVKGVARLDYNGTVTATQIDKTGKDLGQARFSVIKGVATKL